MHQQYLSCLYTCMWETCLYIFCNAEFERRKMLCKIHPKNHSTKEKFTKEKQIYQGKTQFLPRKHLPRKIPVKKKKARKGRTGFIARQADSHESLEFPIRANHPIRANRANRFARIMPLSAPLLATLQLPKWFKEKPN